MKKNKSAIIILLIALLALVFSSCGDNGKKTTIPIEEQLLSALESFVQEKYIRTTGSYSLFDKEYSDFDGIFDVNMHKAFLKTTEATYYYFSSTRFVADDDGIIIKDYMTFEQMKKLLSATLLNFNYDNGNIRNLRKTNNTYTFEFIGVGTQYSFNSETELYGGYMSITVDSDNNIQKTSVSAKYKIGSTENNFLASASYTFLDSYNVITPEIMPSPDSRYAKFQLDLLARKYEGVTLKEDVSSFDTQSEIADLPTTQSNMKSVVSQINEEIVTLTIELKTPQIIIGINSETNKLELRYKLKTNDFLSLKVNDGKRYVFK